MEGNKSEVRVGRRIAGVCIALIALMMLAAPAVSAARSASAPETFTEVLHDHVHVEMVEPDACGGVGGVLTTSFNVVVHMTLFSDGRYHVTTTSAGNFVLEGDNGITYTGHFAGRYGENLNSKNMNIAHAFTIIGRGSDGSSVKTNLVMHLSSNANDDLVVDFSRANCHDANAA